jgi:hypothetical protein
MTWLSAAEVNSIAGSLPLSVNDHWATSSFLSAAFYVEQFDPVDTWATAIVLTPEGQLAKDILSKQFSKPDSLLNFFLFRDFYQRGLLVDCEATDLQTVTSLLQDINSARQAQWPNVFGKELYMKFNLTYDGNRTEFLEAEWVSALLAGTPAGIFQVGNLLCGPFGFIQSEEKRLTKPTLKLPLWHCSDLGCRALHHVRARQYNSEFNQFCRDASRILYDNFGPPSEWSGALDKNAKGERPASGRPFADMTAFLCDCVIGTELQILCERALRSSAGSRVRSLISQVRELKGSPEQIAQSLTSIEQQQLLLMFKDSDLVSFIDELVGTRKIDIHPSEVRTSKTSGPLRYTDHATELSSLGLRSTSHPPIIRLYGEIWQAYTSLGLLEDLTWRVKRAQGAEAGLGLALMDYIRQQGPEVAVRNLIFPSKAISAALEQKLQFRLSSSDSEQETIRKILWKLGFSVARYEKDQQILRNRISEFKAAALRMPVNPTEEDCAVVRSIGVNLFVSVETLLEELIAFNVWVLSSDHFSGTQFTYAKSDALLTVQQHLGARVDSGEAKFYWSADGTNTLGTLLVYLGAFRKWLSDRATQDRLPLRRAEEDYPHYAGDPLWQFAFKHKEFWADAAPERLAEYSALIESVYTQAVQADLAHVRNGLDHKRNDGDFPTADRMLACASRLEQIVDLADHRNLIPKFIWPLRSERDSFGNLTLFFEDYKGAISTIAGPSPVRALSRHEFGTPYVAAPLNFLAIPNAELLFTVSPRSDYSNYWNAYPLRRYIPTRNSALAEGANTATTDVQVAADSVFPADREVEEVLPAIP